MAANLRGLPAQSFYEWVDYCNAPAGSTTLAELRATGEAASREPFGVEYWGVGNESWGCGGNFTADEYAMEFRRFTAAVPGYGGAGARFIASGPGGPDPNWTRGFFSKMAEKGQFNFYGWGLHHYSWNLSRGATDDWDKGKGDALRFDLEEWYELLRQADRMESLVKETWASMGEFDRAHRVKLAVDEWGAWYRPGTEVRKGYILSQAQTLRDALLSGLTLDTFNRHADKVVMSNVAQLVNCLHSLFLAYEDKFVATPNFHVFEMYAPHQGAQSLRAVFDAPEARHTRAGKPATFWGLNGSASLAGKTLTLTVVNPHAAEAREAEITLRGASARAVRARVLTAADIHAQNTFEDPRAVEPRDGSAASRGAATVHGFAPASVTRLQFDL
jgi:alpha-N-arabinofuranosidase